jgi:glutamate-ammonia-ligase adenylyltransferase
MSAGNTIPGDLVPPRRLAPLDAAEARKWLAELHSRLKEEELADFSAALSANSELSRFLGSVFTLSAHLRDICLIRPALLASVLSGPFDPAVANIREQTASAGLSSGSDSALMAQLRECKRAVSLLCGLADLGGWWKTHQVTAALTDFADAALGAAIDHLLLGLHAAGKVELADPARPQQGSGLIVLGMGKYGAHELNYSSDIDLVLFQEQAQMRFLTDDPAQLLARFARSLVRLLQERTGDGYVFRVDLRLRPDPGSTPLVIPAQTALNYYEAYGQNWERAALIKARPVAGDLQAGKAILAELAPFIWRKYLDFAAISDIHSIKRQIHAHRGHGEIAVAGHNIKLGRGGIREIEFFAQTQQLIAGGRLPQLRRLRTVDALAALLEEGWIDAAAHDQLCACYWFLRDVEHRIQMVADEQSHSLPDDEEGLRRIALMMGEKDAAAFSARLVDVLRKVERHYAGLFEKSPELTVPGGNLVFTGDDDDPATVETLAVFGYRQPSVVIATVRGWHYGRYPAMRTAQARELLTEITPSLLQEIARAGDPDATLSAFDRFLSGLPAGIQLFSLLKSNPGLLQLVLFILSAAPRLSEIVTRRPHVFDGLLDPAFSTGAPRAVVLRERLAGALARADGFEAALDAARIFAAEQKFLIGMRLISRTVTPAQAGRAFSDLAETLTVTMLDRVEAEFVRRHGHVPGGRICILGMGRLGSRELSAGSDLDLIFLYEHDARAEESDGEKPLAVSQYFMRLTQRLIAAMRAPTAEGVIYELDFRLRPSGNAGPLATHVDSFLRYQREEAWTWERQALTRARTIAGDAKLRERMEHELCVLAHEAAEPGKLARDVREMRELIDKEKGSANPFDVKNVKGGLIDIEFVAQWAALRRGLPQGEARRTGLADMLRVATPQFVWQDDCEKLLAAAEAFNAVLQLVRVCSDDGFDAKDGPKGLGDLICRELDLPDLRAVTSHLHAMQKEVREIFLRVVK